MGDVYYARGNRVRRANLVECISRCGSHTSELVSAEAETNVRVGGLA